MRDSGSISIKEKILIVCQVIAGEKVQPVAKKHRVSRPSIYAWTKKALDNLEQTLKPGKWGSKFKKGKVDARDETIEEQKEKQIKNLRGKINLQKNGLPPSFKVYPLWV